MSESCDTADLTRHVDRNMYTLSPIIRGEIRKNQRFDEKSGWGGGGESAQKPAMARIRSFMPPIFVTRKPKFSPIFTAWPRATG